MNPEERIRPSEETREAERREAQRGAGADREPTPEEEQLASELSLDPEVARHEKEMAEKGANQEGEGRIP